MRSTFTGTAVVLFVALTGCVGKLATTPNRTTTSLSMARAGTSYALPKVQYDVKLTRTLVECPGELIDNDPAKPSALKFRIGVTATPTYVAGESYNVDYTKLPGWLRTASFEIKLYPNGTLKSLGASAEDRTAETISGAVKTALSAATVLAAASFTDTRTPPAAGSDRMVGCTPTALLLVHESDDLDARLKQSTKALAALQAQAEYFKSAGTARILDAAGRAQFLVLLNALFAEEQRLNGLKLRQEEIAGKLSVSESFTWSGSVTSRPQDTAHPLSAANTDKLAALVAVVDLPPLGASIKADTDRRALLPDCYGANPNINVCIQKQLAVRSGVHLYRDLQLCGDDSGRECLSTLPDTETTLISARDDVADSGIFIREAMEGQLLFCREISISLPATAPLPTPVPDPTTGTAVVPVSDQPQVGQPLGSDGGSPAAETQGADGTTGGSLNGQGGAGRLGSGPAAPVALPAMPACDLKHDEAKLASANFPQFGQLRFLGFRVGTFQAREMALSMTEAGRLDSFTYKSTKAPAERLASLTADVTGQYATFREARETENRDDVKYERESALAELQAQIDTLTKQAALKKVQAPEEDPLKSTRDETAAIEAEIALLKAKAERIKAEAALGSGS